MAKDRHLRAWLVSTSRRTSSAYGTRHRERESSYSNGGTPVKLLLTGNSSCHFHPTAEWWRQEVEMDGFICGIPKPAATSQACRRTTAASWDWPSHLPGGCSRALAAKPRAVQDRFGS